MQRSPILQAEGVSKRYDHTVAPESASLSVQAGECVALVGESGSGKTTLLRCFNRMVEPDAGSIRVDGREVSTSDPIALRRHIGYVQQEGGLLPHWRVQRNVALVPWLLGSAEAQQSAAEALDLVGLPADVFGRRWPAQLSGGQRQRVAIARALAAKPSIVLLDEPFGALDAITRAELQETFLGLLHELRITVLLVTHDLLEAFRLANRIAVMRHGRIDQFGTAAELSASPSTPYVAKLLDMLDAK